MLDFGLDIDRAKKFLHDKGYIIIDPVDLDSGGVKNSSDLVKFFYSTLKFYNINRKLHYVDHKRDRAAAKRLIESRKKSGCNTERAVEESVQIVKCVIENEKYFNLSFPINSMDIFGQDTFGWVTAKAIGIINKEDTLVERDKNNKFLEDVYNKFENEDLKEIESKTKKLRNFLKDLEDGKETRE